MSDPRPEHRAMLEMLVRIRALLRSKAMMEHIWRSGAADALRAEVARIIDTYSVAMSDEEVRALRLDIPARLRAVHATIDLPEPVYEVSEPVIVRSGDRASYNRSRWSLPPLLEEIRGLLSRSQREGVQRSDASNTMGSADPSTGVEVIFARVSGPRWVEVREEVSVEAWYVLHADDDGPRLSAPFVDGQVRVEVNAQATGALELLTPPRGLLTAAPGTRPGGITFRCRALRGGTGQVRVVFRAGGDECTITHDVGVVGLGELLEQRQMSRAERCARLHPGLARPEIEVVAHMFDLRLDVELTDASGAVHHSGMMTLSRAVGQSLRSVLRDAWRLGEQQPSESRERQLGVIGDNLARELLTPHFIGALASRRAGQLRVKSADPSLPWEMLRLAGPDVPPLAEMAALVRAPLRGRAGRLHRRGEAVLVTPDAQGAGAERGALAALGLGGVCTLHTVAQFADRQLSSAPIGVLHFACPAEPRVDGADCDGLELSDGVLFPGLVLDDPERSAVAGALVFLNPSRVNRVEPRLLGHHVWARAFLAAGAAGVIVPLCAIDGTEATAFAVAVYRELRDGRPIDEAVRCARRHRALAAPGSFERLVYVVYAPPGVGVCSAGTACEA